MRGEEPREATIEVDLTTSAADTCLWVAKHGCHLEEYRPNGPGGGNPVARIRGRHGDLLGLLMDGWADSEAWARTVIRRGIW